MRPPTGRQCYECPFVRKCLSGWLGAADVDQFILTALSEHEMPCHARVDYEDESWEETLDDVPQCTGRAIFLSNTCKYPRNKGIVRLPADHKTVFSNAVEFVAHHKILD